MKKHELPDSERLFFEQMPVPIAVFQFLEQGVDVLAVSDGFCRMCGFASREEAMASVGSDLYRGIHPDDVEGIKDDNLLFDRNATKNDVVFRAKAFQDPGYHVIHASGSHAYTDTGAHLLFVTYTDEGSYTKNGEPAGSELNRAISCALHEDSILKASYINKLTGLPNMTFFFELAEPARDIVLTHGETPVLLYMDFIGMKFFNNRYGFSTGDALLRSFAKKLVETFSEGNCSHFGADHFVVITREKDLEKTLDRFLRECRELNGENVLPVRVGIYAGWKEDVPVSIACDRAKLACDVMRNQYESGYHYYDQEVQEELELRQYILENLDRAISEKWIRVYYQPIIRAINGRVCDEEALSRWIDPERGFLSPRDFIPVLEEAGVIYKLDLYVLEQVLEKIKKQAEAGLYIVPQSINLSRSDFDACDIVEEIRSRIDAAGIERNKITVEITESTIGRNFEFMKTQVGRFQELGIPVWMDDFGSGYSSLDVLQSIKFDLIKFDMSFMQRLNEGGGGIILTELVKMAAALDISTICEGVETLEQVYFLQDIGCSKLQGFYFCKPIPMEEILERNRKGIQIGFENPEEAGYYEDMGRVNLFDLAVIANEDESAFHNVFSTLPMGIIEIKDDTTRFVRSNQSYRDFVRRFFYLDLTHEGTDFTKFSASFMYNVVRTCCEQGNRAFYDEKMPDGSVVHSFARRVSMNPVNGNIAVAIVVLSITDANEGASYADIARALAADYYSLYYVDLETDDFIEYTSAVGEEDLAMERHGKDFFQSARQDTMVRIYEEDRKTFLAGFTKENILRELDKQGVYTATYRLMDTRTPMYVNMKVMRMRPGRKHLIIGISIVDSQMKQKETENRILREEAAYTRIAALTGDYTRERI